MVGKLNEWVNVLVNQKGGRPAGNIRKEIALAAENRTYYAGTYWRQVPGGYEAIATPRAPGKRNSRLENCRIQNDQTGEIKTLFEWAALYDGKVTRYAPGMAATIARISKAEKTGRCIYGATWTRV